jgi:hypothetical protein
MSGFSIAIVIRRAIEGGVAREPRFEKEIIEKRLIYGLPGRKSNEAPFRALKNPD